jgi:gliding motility-associated-like protein
MAKIYAPSVFTAFMLFLTFAVQGQIPAPPAVSGDTTICVGDTVHLTASHPNQNVTFSWWTAAVGGTQLSNTYFLNTGVLNSTTVFYAQVALGSDISTRTPLTVTTIATPPNITLTSPDTIYTCNFAPVTVTANTTTPGAVVKWYGTFGQGNLQHVGSSYTLTPSIATTILYTSSWIGGCESVNRPIVYIINVGTLSNPNVSQGTIICTGSSTTLSASHPIPGTIFQWYNTPTGGTLLHTGATYSTPALNSTTTYYVAANFNGCVTSGRVPVVVTVTTPPTVLNLASPIYTCAFDTIFITGTNSYGPPGSIRWWSAATGGTLLDVGLTGTILPTTVNQTVWAEAFVGQCTNPTRVPVNILNIDSTVAPTVTTDTTICTGESVTLTASSTIPGAVIQWWDSPLGGNLIQTGPTYTSPVLTANLALYVDITIHNTICANIPRVAVIINVEFPLPAPNVSCTQINESSVLFNWNDINGATGYEITINNGATWVPANQPPYSHLVSGLSSGQSVTFRVRALGNIACDTAYSSVPVTCSSFACTPISASVQPSYDICLGEKVYIEVTNINIFDYRIIFNGGAPTVGTVFEVQPTTTTTYSIVIYNGLLLTCDSLTLTTTVNVHPIPTANPTVVALDSLVPGQFANSFQFTASGSADVTTWQWNFGDGTFGYNENPIHDYANPGVYAVSLVVTNQWGCTDIFYLNTSIEAIRVPEIFIPSGFSPNNDGSNDFFMVYAEYASLESFNIFNQFGNKVFETTDISEGWDGTYQGNDQPPGVYVYTVKLVDRLQQVHTFQGTLTLIR